MRHLANILIVRGVLSPAQIEEALQAQALYGGGFDTNLMEVTGLTEHQLQPLLEDAHEIHNRIDVFGLPSEEAIRLLRYAQAEKYRVVPFRLVSRVLDLLVHDPAAIATIDEIAFATGCRVVVNVATEARVAWHLERAYGVELSLRLAQLLVRRPTAATMEAAQPPRALEWNPLASSPANTPMSKPASIPPASATEPAGGVSLPPLAQPAGDAREPTPAEARRPARPSGEYSIVRESAPVRDVRQARPSRPPPLAPPASIELRPPVHAGSSSGLTASPPPATTAACSAPLATPLPTPGEFESLATPDSPASGSATDYQGIVWTGRESLDAAFARVESRNEIPALLFGYLGARLERMLLFTARDGTLSGWDGRGPRVRRESVEAVVLSLTEPSVLQGACEHGLPFLGALPFGDVEESLLVRLGGVWPQHVVLWPIRVRDRTVALFYGEATSGEALHTAREPTAQAVTCVEQAFVRLILARKRTDSWPTRAEP